MCLYEITAGCINSIDPNRCPVQPNSKPVDVGVLLVGVFLVVVGLADEAALETAGMDEPAFLGDDLTPGVLTLSCH